MFVPMLDEKNENFRLRSFLSDDQEYHAETKRFFEKNTNKLKTLGNWG